jgi:hypothetical protein
MWRRIVLLFVCKVEIISKKLPMVVKWSGIDETLEFGLCCRGFKAKEESVLGHKQKLNDLSNCFCESLLLHL